MLQTAIFWLSLAGLHVAFDIIVKHIGQWVAAPIKAVLWSQTAAYSLHNIRILCCIFALQDFEQLTARPDCP